MGSQPVDNNYKSIPANLYDPVGVQFVSPQAGPVRTGTDNTNYAPHVFTPVDGYKATYSAAKQGLVTAASATDIFTLTGSATKTVRVTRVEVSGVATTILDTSVQLIVRTTADTGGTGATVPAVAHDQNSSPATAVATAYTANPTINDASPKPIRSSKILFNLAAPTAGSESGRLVEDFGDRPSQAVVLRGANQQLAVNLNGITIQGPSVDISVEWTEE
jgi:hypothetical protein